MYALVAVIILPIVVFLLRRKSKKNSVAGNEGKSMEESRKTPRDVNSGKFSACVFLLCCTRDDFYSPR